MTKLEEFFANQPKGSIWPTGEMMQALGEALMEDRAVLAQGCGDEIPTPSGRQLRIPVGYSIASYIVNATDATVHPCTLLVSGIGDSIDS